MPVADRVEDTLSALERPVLDTVETALADVADELATRLAAADVITAQGSDVDEAPLTEIIAGLWAAQTPAVVAELAAVYGIAVAALLDYVAASLTGQIRRRLEAAYEREARTRLDGVGARLAATARRVLDRGRTEGDTLAQLKTRLVDGFVRDPSDLGDTHARVIAETETGTAWEQGRMEALRALPAELAPAYKRWITAGDSRVRATHAAVGGATIPLDGAFTVGAALMDRPRDITAPPAEIVYCRCSLAYTNDRSRLPADVGQQFLTPTRVARYRRRRDT